MYSKIRFWLALAAAASLPLGLIIESRRDRRTRWERWRDGAQEGLTERLPELARGTLESARPRAAHLVESARPRAAGVLETVRERAGDTFETAVERAGETFETFRDRGREGLETAAGRTREGIGTARERGRGGLSVAAGRAQTFAGAARDRSRDTWEGARESNRPSAIAASLVSTGARLAPFFSHDAIEVDPDTGYRRAHEDWRDYAKQIGR